MGPLWMRRLAWMLLLWVAGVAMLGLVALLLHWLMVVAGMR